MPHNDSHSKVLIVHKLPRLNEDRFCPQSVKNSTVSVFHTKNRNVLFTILEYNSPLEESKTTPNAFYSQLNHTGIPRGGSKAIH